MYMYICVYCVYCVYCVIYIYIYMYVCIYIYILYVSSRELLTRSRSSQTETVPVTSAPKP